MAAPHARAFILAALCAAVVAAHGGRTLVNDLPIDELTELMEFESWRGIFRAEGTEMAYGHPGEVAKRAAIFESTLASIRKHNLEEEAGRHTYRKGVNQFSDLTPEEFKARVSSKHVVPADRSAPTWLDASAAPASIDWRTKGAVTAVKNQGSCGSCWSFSSTGSMEGAFQIATGTLRSLSEQQLVDCSSNKEYGNLGCKGGSFDAAFKYVLNNNGLDSEKDYPYQGMEFGCWKNASARHVAALSNYTNVPPSVEAQLVAAAALGPVSVAVEADKSVFQSYKSGVMNNATCGTKLDHGVLVVGYTATYWIVKNSWGATWGNKGYIMIGRGSSKDGICGINMDPTQPQVPKGTAPPLPPPTKGPEPMGLKCNCTASCVSMCGQFGMACCGNGTDCNCSNQASCPQCKPGTPSLAKFLPFF